MPEIIEKALNMAIIATNAEKKEKVLTREARGSNTNVFTVGGSREGIPVRRYDRPQGKYR
jgi:hypothetical protein